MPPRPYQVREEDKDFLTLSANLGVDYSQLRQANPYVQSLSQGQFINVPRPSAQQSHAALVANVQQHQQAIQPPTTPAMTAGASAGAGALSPSFSNTFSSPAAAQSGTPPGVLNYSQLAASSANPSAMSAFRQEQYVTNQVTALDQFFQQNGYLPANIPSDVMAAMIAQGANPAQIKQLQEQGAAAQTPGASDPLSGTPGHYYVDETTAPFVGRVIIVRGKKRILRTDKDGRLYYQKIGQSRRGRAINRQRRAAAAAAAVAPAAAEGNMVTALNVVLGS